MRRPLRPVLAGLTTSLVLALGACGGDAEPPAAAPSPDPSAPSETTPPLTAQPSAQPTAQPTARPSTEPTRTPRPPRTPRTRVLAISVDGLNVEALARLSANRTPAYSRLIAEGAATLEARTEVELTVTLPNHTGMLTGRRVDADAGGHGVTWNDDRIVSTVPGDGGGVASVFDVVDQAGGSTALFTSKAKFGLFERSWGDAIDTFVVDEDNAALVAKARADLLSEARQLTFVHLSLPDVAGHASGWMSPAYLDAVERSDELVGSLLDAVESRTPLRRRVVVVLTADHGGTPGTRSHSDAGAYADFRVPFAVWGAGVDAGDLYDLNPDRRDPGRAQPSYDGGQPVRNGDLANLALDLLGLGPVPGSELNAAQDLDVTY